MSRLRMIAGCLVLLVGGLQVWTQYRAYHYRYHPAIGTPVWQVHAFYSTPCPVCPLGRPRLGLAVGRHAARAGDRRGWGGEWNAARPYRSVWGRRPSATDVPTPDAGAWHHHLGHQEGRAAVETVCPARAGARELPGEGAPLRWPGERVAGRPTAGRERHGHYHPEPAGAGGAYGGD